MVLAENPCAEAEGSLLTANKQFALIAGRLSFQAGHKRLKMPKGLLFRSYIYLSPFIDKSLYVSLL